jgi:hypothetical protein
MQGGAVFASGFLDLSCTNRGVFRNNKAGDSGDDFYAVNTENSFYLSEVSIINPKALSSIYAERVNLKFN